MRCHLAPSLQGLNRPRPAPRSPTTHEINPLPTPPDQLRIMRRHDHRSPTSTNSIQPSPHPNRTDVVQRGRRLVSQHHPRPLHQHPSHRHALLFPAAEQSRTGALTPAETDSLERVRDTSIQLRAGHPPRPHHPEVLRNAPLGDDRVVLHHEPDDVAPQQPSFAPTDAVHIGTEDPHRSSGRSGKSTETPQQRALALTRDTSDREGLTRSDRQADVVPERARRDVVPEPVRGQQECVVQRWSLSSRPRTTNSAVSRTTATMPATPDAASATITDDPSARSVTPTVTTVRATAAPTNARCRTAGCRPLKKRSRADRAERTRWSTTR